MQRFNYRQGMMTVFNRSEGSPAVASDYLIAEKSLVERPSRIAVLSLLWMYIICLKRCVSSKWREILCRPRGNFACSISCIEEGIKSRRQGQYSGVIYLI